MRFELELSSILNYYVNFSISVGINEVLNHLIIVLKQGDPN